MEAPELQRMATQFTHEKQQGQGKLGSGVVEQFMVEDLLDFSNEDGDEEGGDVGLVEVVNSSADSSTVTAAMDYCSSNSSSGYGCGGGSGGGPCLSSELCVPYDEIAELEWLSNIVEESFSTEDLQKLQLISGVKSSSSSDISTPTTADNLTANSDTFAPEKTVVPGKARSKRSRTAPVNWTSRILLLPGTYTANTALPESELLGPPPSKAAKTVKKKENPYDGLIPASDGRKCLHCATDKTPQWRTGPLGPKTLCNACGVRYKSGRLVPEYRPAASPTFIVSKHSNSHRKVLELRRQKEMVPHQNPQFVHHHHNHSNGAMFDSSVTVTGGGGDGFLIHHHHQQHLGSDFRQLI